MCAYSPVLFCHTSLQPKHRTMISAQRSLSCVTSLATVAFFQNLFTFPPCHKACRILVPRPGTEPMLPAVETQNLNHWINKDIPPIGF